MNTTSKERISFKNILFSTPGVAILLMILSITMRMLTAQPIDTSGDAFWVWRMCRDFLDHSKPFAPPGIWDHRMLRWALALPMIISQKLFDASPASYYIWPIISSTLTVIFTFLIANKLTSRFVGVLTAITMIFYPAMVYQGSQFMPTGTAAMFVIIAIYCLLKWIDSRNYAWIFLASALVFCGYGAKVTTVFFLPGIILSLLYYSYKGMRKIQTYKPVVVFMGFFLVLFVIECMVFQNITTTPGGRAGCLFNGRHGSVDKRIESLDKKGDTSWRGRSETLSEYLLYFKAYHKYLRPANAFLLNFGFLMAVVLVLFKNKKLYILAFIFIPAYLLFTYAVLGTYPFMRMERINNRYYTVSYAISIIIFMCGIYSFKDRLNFKEFTCCSKKYGLGICLTTITSLVLLYFLVSIPLTGKNVTITRNNFQKVKLARESACPILMKVTNKPKKDWKWIKRYRSFYGSTETSLYARPKGIKIKNNAGEDSAYYILELNKARIRKQYLLSSIRSDFVFMKVSDDN